MSSHPASEWRSETTATSGARSRGSSTGPASSRFEHRGRRTSNPPPTSTWGLPGAATSSRWPSTSVATAPYVLGDGHNHTALGVDDLDGLLRQLAAAGIEPERPPYMPGGREEYRICFVADPDGYRVELLDTALPTP